MIPKLSPEPHRISSTLSRRLYLYATMPTLPNTLAEISHLSDNKNSVFPPPLSNAAFTLDSSGVAGFFGGDSSVAGMATANLIPGRRWVGWFNTPGSYEIAKQYGPPAQLKMCDGLFPQG